MVPNINLIGARKISVINNIIKKCVKKFPSEFDKKGCAIDDFRHWKAVELRSFLLYSGVVVLKDILPEDKYENFLLLHVAFRILLSSNCNRDQIQFTGRCLHNFVSGIQNIFGVHNVFLNVHNLLHFADDCLFLTNPLKVSTVSFFRII